MACRGRSSGLEKKSAPSAPATVSRKVSVCQQFFAEALHRGLIEVNPAARLRGFSLSQDSKTLGQSKDQAKTVYNNYSCKIPP